MRVGIVGPRVGIARPRVGIAGPPVLWQGLRALGERRAAWQKQMS